MHSILKDGSYIQYGPKIIPNPHAEGGGGGGETGINTVKIEFQFEEYPDTPIIPTGMTLGNFLTGREPDHANLAYTYNQNDSLIIDAPIIDDLIIFNVEDASIGDEENFWILNTEEPIISVQGSAEIVSRAQINITGDCNIKLKVITD